MTNSLLLKNGPLIIDIDLSIMGIFHSDLLVYQEG